MRDYLVFTLAATFAAMGGPAGHERRGSETWPGRSAILGLLAAASGIRRNDDYSEVDRLGLAVSVFEQGGYLRDWHTVQTVPSTVVRNPQSRALALAAARSKHATNTTITKRDYRTSPLYGIAVWDGDLVRLSEALRYPKFTLYLGRKSCPLSFPVVPKIVSAECPASALESVELPPWHRHSEAELLVASPEALPEDADFRTEIRYDQPTDREAWHFTARQEGIASVAQRAGVKK